MELMSLIDVTLYTVMALVSLSMLVIGFLLMKNRYRAALLTHASKNYKEHQEVSKGDKVFLNSLKAEEELETILREEGWEHVFLRRRVPVSRVGHNREIDVLAVGPVMLVVEVKHWQGYVWSNGPRWYQRANPVRGTLEFEDVQEDNVVKAAAIRRYLENTRRIQLPDAAAGTQVGEGEGEGSPEGSPTTAWKGTSGTWYTERTIHKQIGTCILPIVVFTNPKVKLDPATVKAKKYVFNLETFRIFAREAIKGNISPEGLNQHAVEWESMSLLSRLQRTLFSRLPRPPSRPARQHVLSEDTQEEVAYALDVLRTWDVIYTHDGRMITGDVQKINAPSAHCMYERQHLLDIHVKWNSGFWGMVKTLLWNEAGSVTIVLTTGKRLAVKKREKKKRDHHGNVFFTITPKRMKRTQNDRIEIKPAGRTRFITLAVADIKSISLSHHLLELEKDIV